MPKIVFFHPDPPSQEIPTGVPELRIKWQRTLINKKVGFPPSLYFKNTVRIFKVLCDRNLQF